MVAPGCKRRLTAARDPQREALRTLLKPHKYPKMCSRSARYYFLADIEVINFLGWVAFMAWRLDDFREKTKVLAEALADLEGDSHSAESPTQEQKRMIDELKKNRRILLHMLHARMTDNYLVYLTSILGEAFRCRPEILRSSEKVEYAEVLSFQTIEDLVGHLAEKKVHDLSYKSVVELEEFFQDRLGTRLVPAEQRDDLIKAVATRNIIVHNRGVRNKLYCRNVGENLNMVGEICGFGIDYLEKMNVIFFQSVKAVDSFLRKKLKIKGLRTDIRKEFMEREF